MLPSSNIPIPGEDARLHPSSNRNVWKDIVDMLHSMRLGLLALVSLGLVVVHLPGASTSPLELFDRGTNGRNGFSPGKLGAVASESSICSAHGTEMLKMGGNAADAVSHARVYTRDVDVALSNVGKMGIGY